MPNLKPASKLRWIEHDSHDKWPRPALFLKSCQFLPDLWQICVHKHWCWDIVAPASNNYTEENTYNSQNRIRPKYWPNNYEPITETIPNMFQRITKQLPFRCPNHFQVIARPSTSHEGHKGRPCLTTGPLDLWGQLWHSATLPMASQHLREEPHGAKLGVSGNGEKTPWTTVLTKNMMINRQFSGYPILRETVSSSIKMIYIYIWDYMNINEY